MPFSDQHRTEPTQPLIMKSRAVAAFSGGAIVAALVALFLLPPGVATSLRPAVLGGHPSAADGYVPPGGISPDDARHPAIAGLGPDLLKAVRLAAADATGDGVELRITSGRRTPAYQQRLLDEAIDTYGEAEARRRVSTPELSKHTTGDAVDVGPTDAAYWLSRYGSAYGLCQVYANEIWHYELLTTPGDGCPPMRPDSAS